MTEPELPAGLVQQLEGARNRRRIVSTVEQHLMAEAFPAPPFETKPPLQPITSLTMLNDVRKRFRNCLGNYAREVLAGSHFFYVWDGDEPAILEVTRVGALGWRSGDLAGLKNASVSAATRRALADALRDVPSLFSEDICGEADDPVPPV